MHVTSKSVRGRSCRIVAASIRRSAGSSPLMWPADRQPGLRRPRSSTSPTSSERDLGRAGAKPAPARSGSGVSDRAQLVEQVLDSGAQGTSARHRGQPAGQMDRVRAPSSRLVKSTHWRDPQLHRIRGIRFGSCQRLPPPAGRAEPATTPPSTRGLDLDAGQPRPAVDLEPRDAVVIDLTRILGSAGLVRSDGALVRNLQRHVNRGGNQDRRNARAKVNIAQHKAGVVETRSRR